MPSHWEIGRYGRVQRLKSMRAFPNSIDEIESLVYGVIFFKNKTRFDMWLR